MILQSVHKAISRRVPYKSALAFMRLRIKKEENYRISDINNGKILPSLCFPILRRWPILVISTKFCHLYVRLCILGGIGKDDELVIESIAQGQKKKELRVIRRVTLHDAALATGNWQLGYRLRSTNKSLESNGFRYMARLARKTEKGHPLICQRKEGGGLVKFDAVLDTEEQLLDVTSW
ncbi:hypothetical protein CEXT_567511 [Caerostris extrusa]|uniref:Uncharacterized protein n=1 Tax=Caerostris extrusa TaxID=172846 RepID=A0AAV4T5T6_CAEEX|nr:hypothetical protein CEXT_567511 [Caerostris extrusa]